MQVLEADFAQIEHINQIIHNSRGHDSWDCFDTHLLLEARAEILKKMYTSQANINAHMFGIYDADNPERSRITGNFKNVRYNSFIVNITKKDEDTFEYEFEIRNALWDGNYRVTKSKRDSSDPDEEFEKGKVVVSRRSSNENSVIFTISGEDSDRVRICFHMEISGEGRHIETTSLKIDNPKEYKHQFDQEVCEPGKITDEYGNPVSGVNVSIVPVDSAGREISKGIKPRTVKDIVDGKFKMCYSAVDTPGDYYVLMKVEGGSDYVGAEATQIIHIQKVQKQSISIIWGSEDKYKNIWKGCIHEFKIKVGITDEFGIHDTKLDDKLKNITFTVTNIKLGDIRESKTCTPTKNSNGEYELVVDCSYRGYYEDRSRLEVEIPIESGFGNKTEQHLVYLEWFKAESFDMLMSEIIRPKGTDWIFLYPKTYYCTDTITIKRPMTLAGLKGSFHCEINGDSHTGIKIQSPSPDKDNYMQVNLAGIAFTNCERAIYSETGCLLNVNRCYFHNNKNSSENQRGCSINMKLDDETLKKSDLWKTEIKNSYFYNNRGNEIRSIGRTHIQGNLFKTTSKEYLQQPEVKVVSVRAGRTTYMENKSYINIPFTNKYDAMASNHSYAKALAYVSFGATFNGKGPNQLQGYNTLPLYSSPWNNQAYTRACYYYPYSNVRTYIVCSPKQGYERKATGHSSAIENWVYYDGYYFTRLENSKGNSYNPWTEEELKIPSNIGIYDDTSKKFDNDYDPRYSGNVFSKESLVVNKN